MRFYTDTEQVYTDTERECKNIILFVYGITHSKQICVRKPDKNEYIHKLFFISKEFISSLPDLPDFQCGTGRCGTGRSVAKKYYLFLSA